MISGKTSDGPLKIDLHLDGKNTVLQAGGYYSSDPASPEINFKAEILKLDLASIEPFTMGQLKNTKGQLKGEVKITGNATKPDIQGEINFVKASFTPSMVNSEFTLDNETIRIENGQIIFPDFEFKDKQNNTAKLDGKISSEGFKNFVFNLGLTATDFQILNSTEKDNELFYGMVKVTTKTKITGPLEQPVIEMNIDLSDDTNFTYVVPQSEKGVLEQQGIVEFADRDAKNDPFLASINPKDTIKATFSSMDLSANIELNDKETFNIIIDPLTGDKLSVKGNSTLTLDKEPTGDLVLSGRYEISEGSYDFSFYKLVKRQFIIEKGSTIMWSGNPLDANLDIRAINKVEASPIELFPDAGDEYKQRLPFLAIPANKRAIAHPRGQFQA